MTGNGTQGVVKYSCFRTAVDGYWCSRAHHIVFDSVAALAVASIRREINRYDSERLVHD